MQAVVLMGGEGTRLRPLTGNLPKAMMPVLNTPFLEHLINYLQRQGVTDIILALGYQSPAIESFLSQRRFHARVRCVVETSPLGTAGAVKNLTPYLEETFFVLNGDIYTDLDLRALFHFHRRQGSKLTIALTPVKDTSRFGVVNTDAQGRITSFVEKPPLGKETSRNISAGIYLLAGEVVERVLSGPSMFERGLFPDLVSQREPVFGFVFSGYWLDMGTPDQYLKLNYDLLQRERRKPLNSHPGVEIRGPIWVGQGVTIEPGARLLGPSVLGPGCYISAGSTVAGSVLWEGVRLDRGAKVIESVIATQCWVGEGCYLERCILGPGCKVEPGQRPEPGTRLEPESRPQFQSIKS